MKILFVLSMLLFTWETPAVIEPKKEVGTGKRIADSLENKKQLDWNLLLKLSVKQNYF